MTEFAAELVVSYARTAEVGKRYMLEVDLQHDPEAWSLRSEEYPIRCVVDVEAFACEAVGDAAIVMHRFGGTYGPARFILSALVVTDAAKLRILLLDTRGSVVYSRALDPIRVVPQQLIWQPVFARHGADDWAVVIGVTDYPRGPLNAPRNDALAFRDWLLWHAGGELPSNHVYLLLSETTGGRREPRGDTIRKTLASMIPRSGRIGRRLYVYAAGHGIEINGVPLLVAADLESFEESLVDVCRFVAYALDGGAFDEGVLFLDAGRRQSAEPSGISLRSPARPRSNAWLFGFATSSGQAGYEYVDDGVHRGPFTQALLEALSAGKQTGLRSSRLAEMVQRGMAERLENHGLTGRMPSFEWSGELQLVPAREVPPDVPPPQRVVPEADSRARAPAVWIHNVSRSIGKVFDTVGSPEMMRGDLIVVFVKEPRLRPCGVYRVERGRRMVQSDDRGDRGTGTSVHCVRVLGLPEPSPRLLDDMRRDLEVISSSTSQRTTRSLTHQRLIELLRRLFERSVEIRVTLEYLLIQPFSAAEFAAYRDTRLHALESSLGDDTGAARIAFALARDVEGNSSRTARDVMQLWRNHARANFSRAHEGLGFCLDLGRADIDELDAVAARNVDMRWLHEHLLRHPNRGPEPPSPSSENPVSSPPVAPQPPDAERAYEYDVYISYRHAEPIVTWVRDFFLPTLRDWLHVALGREAHCFVDQQIEAGTNIPYEIERALRSSRCLVPVFAPSYFTSEWCMHEWRAFSATGRPVLPIRFFGGTTYPEEARSLMMADFTRFNILGKASRRTRAFHDFEEAVQRFAARVAEVLDPRSAGATRE